MKKDKKKFKKVLSTIVICGTMGLASLGLVGCGEEPPTKEVSSLDIYNKYIVYTKDNGLDAMTYEEWLLLIKGVDGKTPEFRVNESVIQWRYTGEETWKDLLEIHKVTTQTVNICYHMNGGDNPEENTLVKELSDTNKIELVRPTKDGYTFENWYLDEECTKVFDGTVCIKDLEEDNTLCLYAKWTNDYIIEGTTFIAMNDLSIESFVIPDYITKIEADAFENCSNLKELTIPNSVEYMGWGSIFGDYHLSYEEAPIRINYNGTIKEWAEMSIGSSGTSFGRYVELYCSGRSVTRIQAEDLAGITTIGYNIFSDIVNLEEVYISDSVTWISGGAFKRCSNLKNVVIPNSVTEIMLYAFSGCDSLESITIPSSVTDIDFRAFSGCDNLRKVIIESEVIANSLINDPNSYGDDNVPVIQYANTIYIKSGLTTTNSTYLNEKFTKQESSDKEGYDKWVRN